MAKILIVEDDSFFRQIFSDLLKEEGYHVDLASSGGAAMERLASRDYHVVITDLMLPGTLSGIEVARQVSADPRGIRLLCITGYSEQLVSGSSTLAIPTLVMAERQV